MALFTLHAVPMAFSPEMSEEPSIREVRFDDGYVARSKNGLNPLTQRWTIPFRARTFDEMWSLMTFFRSHGGVVPFLWTPPGEPAAKRFVCKRWSRNQTDGAANRFDISAEFEEDHGLAV